jgi:hydroxyacid-oxoacid transhydrogenase
MLLAATFSGIGFSNAGVHLPHAMSYPIAGLVRNYTAPDYNVPHPLIPHGMAVLLTSPAVYRFTAPADPERHLYIASLLGVDVTQAREEQAGEILAQAIIDLMQRTSMPNGLRAVGYSPDDIPEMVAGTIPQQRLTKLSPRPFDEADLAEILLDAMSYW